MAHLDMDMGVREEACPRWIWTWAYKRRHGPLGYGHGRIRGGMAQADMDMGV